MRHVKNKQNAIFKAGVILLQSPAPASQNKPREGKAMFSRGTIYRWGQRIKDFGERVGHVKIRGVFIFSRLSGWIVDKGLAIKDSVHGCPIREM